MRNIYVRIRTARRCLSKVQKVVLLVLIAFLTLFLMRMHRLRTSDVSKGLLVSDDTYHLSFSRLSPLIFIGGFPRSGTTLMRAMMDAHPHVRCGLETRVLPRIIDFRLKLNDEREIKLLAESGITEELLDRATANFILDIIVFRGKAAVRLCNKDPFLMSSAQYISHLFPRAKFIFMVRDGRASVYSATVTIAGYDFKDPRSCLEKWSRSVARMYEQCHAIGPHNCLMVHYEQLVLHPGRWMREILSFLDLPWAEAVLHHERHINQTSGVQLSRFEKSSDQIIKPINIEALSKWVGFYSEDVLKDMGSIAPMLATLGYDSGVYPPNYGIPDDSVAENTKRIQEQVEFWKENALHLAH